MTDVNVWLERAAMWRFASLLFQEPHDNRATELAVLAGLVPEARRSDASALAADTADRQEAYYRTLGPGGCPATESAYDRSAIANRGPLLSELSAFYDAFAYPPRLTSDLTPDHVVVELDFLGFLALKVAFALHDGYPEESAVARHAYDEFLERHLGFWIGVFAERLESEGHAPFASAARWVMAAMDRAPASAC